MIITLLLFFMILAALRFMIVDMLEFSNQISHNTSAVNTMQNTILTLNGGLKDSYKTTVTESVLTLTTLDENITFEIKENALYKNNTRLIDLTGIEIRFEDATLEVNEGNGAKIIKVHFNYIQKTKSMDNEISFSRYIGTLE